MQFTDTALRIENIVEGPRIRFLAIPSGDDISVTISGGDSPHVGGMAMSVISPALHDPEALTCTEQIISAQGHKEGELARLVATCLAKKFSCTVSVACGIHVHKASPEDIATIVVLVEGIALLCAAYWQDRDVLSDSVQVRKSIADRTYTFVLSGMPV